MREHVNDFAAVCLPLRVLVAVPGNDELASLRSLVTVPEDDGESVCPSNQLLVPLMDCVASSLQYLTKFSTSLSYKKSCFALCQEYVKRSIT